MDSDDSGKKITVGKLCVIYSPQENRLIIPGFNDQNQELLQPIPKSSKFLQKLEEKRKREKDKK